MIKPKPLTALNLTAQTNKDVKSRNFSTPQEHYQPNMAQTAQTDEVWRLKNPYKWIPNDGYPNLLNKMAPLNDNSMTPRSKNRALQLDRNLDKYAWMYNRKSMESLDQNDLAIKKDLQKGKMLKKLLRKVRRNERMANTVQPAQNVF